MTNGFWGWVGLGGSMFQWNEDLEISFAYVPADLIPMQANVRAYHLRNIVADCVRRMEEGGNSDEEDRMGGFVDWSEDKDRIIMTGADGSMLYIEMAATKIAASLSVATIAAMTLW